MTRMLFGAMVALGLLMSSCQPVAFAGGALIATTAPLADGSEQSVKAAVTAAIDKAVIGASAMGFGWFQLRNAQVSGNEVAIEILATDEEPGQADEVNPGTEPDATKDQEPTDQPDFGPPIPATSRVQI